MSNNFEQFQQHRNTERATDKSSNHMMGEVVASGYHCHNSSDSHSKSNSANEHLPSVSIGKNSDSSKNSSSTGGDATTTNPATTSGESTVTTTNPSSGSESTATAAYSPANDAALQNLSNTGDAALKSDLLKAYGDVQSGQLSQSAYNQFENTTIPLTDPNSDASKGLSFATDAPLEQHALNSISSNMSASDASTLQNIINGQTGDTTGGSSSGSTGGDTNAGGGSSSGSTTPTESAYNPANDAALQNLPNTNDAPLQQALLSAYGDVQNGTLSQDSYNKFESAAIPLTDPNSDASKGLTFQTDIPLEQYALSGIGSQINSSDAATLQGIIDKQSGASSGGSTSNGGGSTPSTGDGGNSNTNTNGDDSNYAPTTVNSIVDQNTQSDNTVFPSGGVQSDGYGWAKGATGGWPSATMPGNANESVTWMDLYPTSGSAMTQGAEFTAKNFNEYALLKNGQWEQISTANKSGAWAQYNPNNMQGITGSPSVNYNSDGSFSVAAAPDGNVDQIGGPGGNFDPSQIVGIYDSAEIKSNVANPNAAAQIGADWYSNGQYVQQIGSANWVQLNDQYQTVTMTNIDAATLAKNPPPGATS